MTFQERVNQFVSDAVYRIGELGHLMDALADNSNYQYRDMYSVRRDLSNFLAILRHTTMSIKEGTTFLDWSEYDIEKEMQFLRRLSGMNQLPIMNFLNHAVGVLVIQQGGSNGGGTPANFPAGLQGMTIFYNVSNQPYADYIDPYAGMGNDDINTYFAGRP
jgi:hypothetical protein